MISRIWHGKTKTYHAEIYRHYVMETGIPGYLSTPGNLGAQIWQRQVGDITHIWTISWWKDYESIRAFAGEDFEKAKYYEEDKKYLLEFEPEVMHAECYNYEKTQSFIQGG
ncbi:MAG: antibiotic biosynthesis monooxygenase [Bacteroidetes bacterium]|nr:MAG: antibiotic biosynthesis monooxygenase [Bacteroidota bacterium]